MTESLQKIQSAFFALCPELSEAAWGYVANNCQPFNVSAKEIIIEEHKIQKHIYFLNSGLVRGFYINEKGEEITIHFVNNTGWITHYTALISETPSKYIFQALEQCELIALPFQVIQEGYRQFKGLERFGRLIAERVLLHQQNRIEGFQFLTAEQRYLRFIEDYPALFNRVSISHLSTYLGIQRQSLTRIRKKIASQ